MSDSLGRVLCFKVFTYGILGAAFTGLGLGYWLDIVFLKVLGLSIFIGQEAILCAIITYVINESCTTSSTLRSRSIAIYFILFAMGGAILSGLTFWVTNPDVLYLIMACLTLLCAIPIQWVILEPPKQLHKMGRVLRFFTVLKKMADRNGKGLEMEDILRKANLEDLDINAQKFKLETILTCSEKMTLFNEKLKLVFCSQHIKSLIGFSLVAGVVYVNFFGVTYNAGEIGLPSLQMNVVFLSVVEAICYVVSLFVVAGNGRKKLTWICFGLITLGGASLVLCKKFIEEGETEKWIETAVTCVLIKGGLSIAYIVIYAYGSELFPTSIRGTAVGLSLTVARFIGLTSSELISVSKS